MPGKYIEKYDQVPVTKEKRKQNIFEIMPCI